MTRLCHFNTLYSDILIHCIIDNELEIIDVLFDAVVYTGKYTSDTTQFP